MKTLRTFLIQSVWVCLVTGLVLTASAQPKEEQLKQKELEIQKLKQQLDQAQREIKSLKKELTEAPKVVVAKPDLKPLTPIPQLPPLNPEEMADAGELARYFKDDPSGAAARYVKQQFKVKGVILGFSHTAFVQVYEVLLESPERTLRVTCHFNYPDGYKAIYPGEGGNTLVGRIGDKVTTAMLKVGDEVVIKGRCSGYEGGRVHMRGCVMVSRKQS